MSYDTFTLPAGCAIRYPEEVWGDPDIVTQYEDQISVQVVNTGSGGFWQVWHLTIEAPESAAQPAQTAIFTFLRNHRLRGVPFYFNHRKWGTKLVRYWPDKAELPMPRRLAGKVADLIVFDFPLRAIEGGV